MEQDMEMGSSTTILHNAVIVTMDNESRVFRNGGVFIARDQIKAIGQSADILQQFSSLTDQIVDLQGRILLPGNDFISFRSDYYEAILFLRASEAF